MSLGAPHLHRRETDSTNARARALAVAGGPHGTIVTAAAQTAGRGRQGRSWSAPPGQALLLSVVLRDPPELVPLRAAVAVAELCGAGAAIKWPNDVLLAGRKVAGILAEGRPQEGWVVLGIGLNVAVDVAALPPELHGRAGSLGREPSELPAVRDALLRALEDALDASAEAVLERWRARDWLARKPVAWGEGEGVAAGVDAGGRLLVDRADGRREALDAGEVHLRAG